MTIRGLLTLLIAGLSLSACTSNAPVPGSSIEEFSAFLDERVGPLMKRYDVPGALVALVHKGQPAWSAAYGLAERASGRPMTLETICRAESISKSVTVWGVLSLVEAGTLSLDEPIESYLSQEQRSRLAPLFASGGSAITLRHLLSNQSGLGLGTIGPPSEYRPGETRPTPLEFVATDAQLVQSPGQGFLYSDVGFNLVELVVEQATGQEFSRVMRSQVLTPLGMDSSDYSWREEYQGRIAAGHELDGTPVAPYVYPAHASGGLFVQLEDLARFVAAGMTVMTSNGLRAGVLTSEGIQEAYTSRVPIPGLYGVVADGYGFGHFTEETGNGYRAVWHGGQGHGWMTHFHSIPELGEGIVVLTNSQRSWPFLAELLTEWSAWTGAGQVGFAVITPVTRFFWGLIGLFAFLSLWILFSSTRNLLSGENRWAPLARAQLGSRVTRLGLGLSVIVLVMWRVSLPYVDEASIFPAAAPVAAGVLLSLGILLVCSAGLVRTADSSNS